MKFLIIQTAFIGDVILATSLLEKLHKEFPSASIDLVVKKGNEALFNNHPFIGRVIVWDKKTDKFKNLWSVIKQVRQQNYDIALNLHRFFSSGIIAFFSKAKEKIGFDKNPLSFLYSKSFKHEIGNGMHEVERNQILVEDLIQDKSVEKPKLYPSEKDFNSVSKYKVESYITIAPASVWFTKQFPIEQWVKLAKRINQKIYFLGAPSDKDLCDRIIKDSAVSNAENLAGKLSFLESAALMKDAAMNYVNDSAPMHMASAMNAPVTAIFCSTIPAFGFGPLSDYSKIVETSIDLKCRPCGIHGHKACPKGDFECAVSINIEALIND